MLPINLTDIELLNLIHCNVKHFSKPVKLSENQSIKYADTPEGKKYFLSSPAGLINLKPELNPGETYYLNESIHKTTGKYFTDELADINKEVVIKPKKEYTNRAQMPKSKARYKITIVDYSFVELPGGELVCSYKVEVSKM